MGRRKVGKMKVKFKIGALALALMMAFNSGVTCQASASSACKHTNMVQRGSTVGNWTVSHTVTLSQSIGPQTCTGSAWVEEVYLVCTQCGYSVFLDKYYHEKHNICGINY